MPSFCAQCASEYVYMCVADINLSVCCVCLSVCLQMCVCVCVCVCLSLSLHMCVCVCLSLCVHACVCVSCGHTVCFFCLLFPPHPPLRHYISPSFPFSLSLSFFLFLS